MATLEIQNLRVSYGNIQALKDVSLKVNDGEIVTLIGNNGAGKTTIMNTILGLIKPSQGKILFEGKDIIKENTCKIVNKGISLVPEGRQVFPNMSVLENLKLGAYIKNHKEVSTLLEEVFTLFPRLQERTYQKAGTLSGGEQQMLAMGRGLMNKPKILLLDEPSMGLAPIIVGQIFELIQYINSKGTTILLVEQNARQALKISNRGYVIETGKVTVNGNSEELLKNNVLINSYLGVKGV